LEFKRLIHLFIANHIMPIIQTAKGNLLDAKEPVICQQSNCATMKGHGLSKQISVKYPWADVYARRVPLTPNCAKIPSYWEPFMSTHLKVNQSFTVFPFIMCTTSFVFTVVKMRSLFDVFMVILSVFVVATFGNTVLCVSIVFNE